MIAVRRENKYIYDHLAGILREQIVSGFIKPGQYLLSEGDLCKHYDVSRNTVRKALEELIQEGLVVKKTGNGTYVRHDLVIPQDASKELRIITRSESNYVDFAFPHILEAFKRDYPNVKVKVIRLSYSEFEQTFQLKGDFGFEADVCCTSDTSSSRFPEVWDRYRDLTDIVSRLEGDMYPKLLNVCRVGERIVSIPITFSPVFMVYNPRLFASAGVDFPDEHWSPEQFTDTLSRLTLDTDGDGIVDQYGFSLLPHIHRWPVFLLQHGLAAERKHAIRLIRDVFSTLHDMLHRKRLATVHWPLSRDSGNVFAHGKSAMTLITTFQMARWAVEKIGFTPVILPLSIGPVRSTLLQANELMIPPSCQNEELATAFIRTAIRKDVQEAISRATPFLSVRKSVNVTARGEVYLKKLNIDEPDMERNYFLQELFPIEVLDMFDEELGMFWLGLEKPADVTARLVEMISTLTNPTAFRDDCSVNGQKLTLPRSTEASSK
jgi:multiple sugar transport system substrate-binding protein